MSYKTPGTQSGQNPMIIDRTCHGVQQKTKAPRMTVMVRNALRARFSLLLCAGVLPLPPVLLARNIGAPWVDEFFLDFLLPCRDDLLLLSASVSRPAYPALIDVMKDLQGRNCRYWRDDLLCRDFWLRRLKPELIDSMPVLTDSKPKFVDSKPELMDTKPELIDTKPELIDSKPKLMNSLPELIGTMPEFVDSMPELVSLKPELIDSMLVRLSRRWDLATVSLFIDTSASLTSGVTLQSSLRDVLEWSIVAEPLPVLFFETAASKYLWVTTLTF